MAYEQPAHTSLLRAMKPKRHRAMAFAATSAGLLVAVVWFGLGRSRAALPVYEGKTVQEWFFGADGHPGRPATMKAAGVAFEAMGTNCVPFLLDRLRSHESGSNRFYGLIYPGFPSFLKSRWPRPLAPYYSHKLALWHLRNMMPKLAFAASDLMEIVPGISDDQTREQAYDMVEHLAIRLDDVGKKRAYLVGFLVDPNFALQLKAAIMLSRVDRSFTDGIPILINAVTNTSLMDSTFRSPYPGLAPDQTPFMRRTAFEALKQIAPLLAQDYCVAQ
jgi:hypothetical protein